MIVPQMHVFDVFDAFDVFEAYMDLKISRFLTRTTYGLCTDHLRTIYGVSCCVVCCLLSVVCYGLSVVGWWFFCGLVVC